MDRRVDQAACGGLTVPWAGVVRVSRLPSEAGPAMKSDPLHLHCLLTSLVRTDSRKPGELAASRSCAGSSTVPRKEIADA